MYALFNMASFCNNENIQVLVTIVAATDWGYRCYTQFKLQIHNNFPRQAGKKKVFIKYILLHWQCTQINIC